MLFINDSGRLEESEEDMLTKIKNLKDRLDATNKRKMEKEHLLRLIASLLNINPADFPHFLNDDE